jgi:signal transduction histidine kinase
MKYRSPDRPLTIHVSAIRKDDRVVITVKDNGIGLDMRYADRIFAAFKRLHGPETPGSGVGLAICRNIVESCGGRLWVDAAPGVGAAFSFTLPPAEPSQRAAPIEATATASVPLNWDA